MLFRDVPEVLTARRRAWKARTARQARGAGERARTPAAREVRHARLARCTPRFPASAPPPPSNKWTGINRIYRIKAKGIKLWKLS